MEQVRKRRKKRKKSKKPLWITLIILLIFGGVGWGGFHYLTHQDVEAEDIGVDQSFFDFSEFEVGSLPVSNNEEDNTSPDENDKSKDDSGNYNKETATNSNNGKERGNNNSTDSPAKQNPNSELKDIEKEIESKYMVTFQSLESAAISKIDTLAENALSDYKSGRSLSDLSSTYMSAANKLQKKLDEVFNNQLQQMKAELKANGLDNDLAEQAEAEYKAAIAAKKSEMLGKVAKIK